MFHRFPPDTLFHFSRKLSRRLSPGTGTKQFSCSYLAREFFCILYVSLGFRCSVLFWVLLFSFSNILGTRTQPYYMQFAFEWNSFIREFSSNKQKYFRHVALILKFEICFLIYDRNVGKSFSERRNKTTTLFRESLNEASPTNNEIYFLYIFVRERTSARKT